jgi:polyisoprenoid-binding protein YceI
MHHRTISLAPVSLALVLALAAAGCSKPEEKKELAPESAELKEDKPTSAAKAYEVSTADSQVTFLMDAELEKIFGRAPKSTSGTLNVDLMDITKTSGLVKIDLLELSIFQKKRGSGDEEFGEETKNDRQNSDMRTWLQIEGDGEKEGNANLAAQKGKSRKLDISVSGTLRLHGRTTEHTFPAEADFTFEGERALGVVVKSKEALQVGLDKHDVRPRSAFNVLADKTLDALGSKVSKIAQISLEISATAQ